MATGVPQSQLSEWLNEKSGVRMGKNSHRILKTIRAYYREGEAPLPDEIETAIRKIWNGDPKRAAVLVNLIESLEPVFE